MPRRNADFDRLAEDWGIHFPEAIDYMKPEWKRDYNKIAMDAQPTSVTTPNAGVPAFFTTLVDPEIIRVLLSPNKAASILGEVQKGVWTDQTAMFQMVEQAGEVSSYGDWNYNGHATINTTFPQRQAYLYQIIIEYGELEMARAGRERLNWAAELKMAAVTILNKFQNLTYFFGVQGLQNYGLVNDPALSASLTPVTKAAPGSGTQWIKNGAPNATSNEIMLDVQSLMAQLVNQTQGLVDQQSELILAMSPATEVALMTTNTFGISARDLLTKNLPNLRIETATQYGAISSTNPQGISAGSMIQLIAPRLEGMDSGYCAFNEKLRNHPLIRDLSAYKQKLTQGTWGSIIRRPVAFAQMVGV